VLGIQTNLITLYSNNLSAIATQAALIGGFSFTAVLLSADVDGPTKLVLAYFYYSCFTICLVTALFVLSQATIVGMFGPTMALKGSTDEAVKMAADKMMSQQYIILKAALIAITALFSGACLLTWAKYPKGIAAITTFIYLFTYYCLVKLGMDAYLTFVPNEGASFVELEDGNKGSIVATSSSSNNYKSVSSSQDGGSDAPQSSEAISGKGYCSMLIYTYIHTCMIQMIDRVADR